MTHDFKNHGIFQRHGDFPRASLWPWGPISPRKGPWWPGKAKRRFRRRLSSQRGNHGGFFWWRGWPGRPSSKPEEGTIKHSRRWMGWPPELWWLPLKGGPWWCPCRGRPCWISWGRQWWFSKEGRGIGPDSGNGEVTPWYHRYIAPTSIKFHCRLRASEGDNQATWKDMLLQKPMLPCANFFCH